MAYTFVQEYIAASRYRLKCPHVMVPTSITVHNTANDASAANENAYMARNDKFISYHTAIDDEFVRQAIPYNRNAFAAGDGASGKGNRTSIHIEICYSKSGGPRYVQAEENAVQYIALLLKAYGWGVDRVKQHYDWSRKNCPHRIRGEGRWQSFIARVQDALDALNVTHTSKRPNLNVDNKIGTQAADDANVFRLQSGRYLTREDAEAALANLLAVNAISYGTVHEFTDGFRIESGAYRGEQAETNARAVAATAIRNGHLGYVTLVGYKE